MTVHVCVPMMLTMLTSCEVKREELLMLGYDKLEEEKFCFAKSKRIIEV